MLRKIRRRVVSEVAGQLENQLLVYFPPYRINAAFAMYKIILLFPRDIHYPHMHTLLLGEESLFRLLLK